MKLLLSVLSVTLLSCSSNIPEKCYDDVNEDIEWFVAALLDRRVDTLIKHFQKTGVKSPVQESLKLIKREAEFYEIWNTRNSQSFTVYENGENIVAEGTFPSGKVLKMIWVEDNWYYHSFDFSE